MSLEKNLTVGDEIYYANTYKRVTPEMLLFMNKGFYPGSYAAIEITPKVAKRFKFVPNATRTIWGLNFDNQKVVNLYFEGDDLAKIRIRNITNTDTLKWDFKPMQLHELQQITEILLDRGYYD